MECERIDKILKKREELLEALSFYNNPPMFDTKNYNYKKKVILKRLHVIADVLYKELNIDKNLYAL